jgi:hypothetical protein
MTEMDVIRLLAVAAGVDETALSRECERAAHGDCRGYALYGVSGDVAVPLLSCDCECHDGGPV